MEGSCWGDSHHLRNRVRETRCFGQVRWRAKGGNWVPGGQERWTPATSLGERHTWAWTDPLKAEWRPKSRSPWSASRLGSAFRTLSKLLQISRPQFHRKWIRDFFQRTTMAPSSMEILFREWSITWCVCSPPTALVPARHCPVIPALSPGEWGLSLQIQKIMLRAATTSWGELAPNLKCICNLFLFFL